MDQAKGGGAQSIGGRRYRLLHVDGSGAVAEFGSFGDMLLSLMSTEQVVPDWEGLTSSEHAVTRRVVRMLRIDRAAGETVRAMHAYGLAPAKHKQDAWSVCVAAETALVQAVRST